MAMTYRGHRHQRVARVLGALAALVMVIPALLLRSLPNVAVICLAVLALLAYERLGHRFDQVDPWASGGVAFLRLALPPPVIVFGVLLSASALAEPGDALGQFTAMAIAFGVLPMIVVLCPLFDIRVSVDTLRAQKLGTPPPPSPNRRLPIVYRSLSSLLMAVAVPPGIAIFYLVNYCRPSTTASTVFGETILFVLIVIAGKRIAGWVMDRVRGVERKLWDLSRRFRRRSDWRHPLWDSCTPGGWLSYADVKWREYVLWVAILRPANHVPAWALGRLDSGAGLINQLHYRWLRWLPD